MPPSDSEQALGWRRGLAEPHALKLHVRCWFVNRHAALVLLNVESSLSAQERMRKDYLRGLYHRTPEQIAEEELLYVEVKRLEENEQKWARDRDGLLKMLAGVESGLPNLKADWDVISGVVVSDRDRKSSRRGLDGMGGYGSASGKPKRSYSNLVGCIANPSYLQTSKTAFGDTNQVKQESASRSPAPHCPYTSARLVSRHHGPNFFPKSRPSSPNTAYPSHAS